MKCDEEKPACRRCVNAGQVCDGYETIRLAQTSTSSSGELTLKWVRPSSQPPDTNIAEQQAFNHFRIHVLDRIAGPFDTGVWRQDVLSTSMSEAAVRNAIIALGALAQHDDTLRSDAFALKHYSMAMRALHDKIPINGQGSSHLALVTCLLFVAFEFQKFGYAEAKSHLDGGLSIIRELQDCGKHGCDSVSESLVEAFERLDIQMSLFTSCRVSLNRAGARVTDGTEYRDLHAAYRELGFLTAAMRELVHSFDQRRFSYEVFPPHEYSMFQNEVIHQLLSLKHWEISVNGLLKRLSQPRDLQAARILQAHYFCCKLMVSTAMSDGRETMWDSFIADFQRVLDLAEELQTATPTPGGGDEHHNFKIDMGIIPPVYYTAMKCRNPYMRRHAIEILRRCDYQEGAWHGLTMADMAESIMFVEEGGLDNPQTEHDIPEQNRLYRGWYDLTKNGERLLYCRRRRFEADGRWHCFTHHFGNLHLPAVAPVPSEITLPPGSLMSAPV